MFWHIWNPYIYRQQLLAINRLNLSLFGSVINESDWSLGCLCCCYWKSP